MYCPSCQRRTRSKPHFGFCVNCYERVVKEKGELATIVDSYSIRHVEEYAYTSPNKVYAYFYRCEKKGRFYQVKLSERRWCLELLYDDGFPCPPQLRFVNPYNHSDQCPTFWPRLSVSCDPLRQVIDLPNVHPRTAFYLNTVDENNPLDDMQKWLPHLYIEAIADKILPDLYDP